MNSFSLDLLPPCVHGHVKKLMWIFTEFENVKKFMDNCLINGCSDNPDEHLRGVYLDAFCTGALTILESNKETINKVRYYLYHSSEERVSYLHAVNECDHLTPILASLTASINKIKSGKFRGCKIIDLCASFIQCGLPSVRDIFISMQKLCLKKLFDQTKLWILQGSLFDPMNEFFIKTSKNSSNIEYGSNTAATSVISVSCATVMTGTASSMVSINNDSTVKYVLNPDNLPSLIPFSVAVKILFIGEALVMCQCNRDANSNSSILEDSEISEEIVLSRFNDMEKCENFVLRDFSSLIDDLWIKINKRICVLSEEVGNVSFELGLLYDIYLLGRGDLFQEFLLKGSHLLNNDVSFTSSKNLNKALKEAFYNVYSTEVSDLVDNFSFILPDRKLLKPGTKTMTVLSLKYNVKWPLHYLFTDDVMECYNKSFRFLLALKKAQVVLTSVCKRINLINDYSLRMEFIEVKMHLLSIIVNLQNYCLTNVITHEMNVLLNAIKSTELFTDLKKVFLSFLCNISNRLFITNLGLSTETTLDTRTIDPLDEVNKRVYTCFLKIFSLCDLFSELLEEAADENVTSKLGKIKNDLYKVLKVLFSLFKKMDQNYWCDDNDTSYAGHLFNLTMCLDYNRFYQKNFQITFGE